MNNGRRMFASAVHMCAAALSLGACTSGGSEQFSTSLGRQLLAQRPQEVDLAAVSSIAWDELFIFDPYSARDDNCAVLNLDLFSCRTTFPAMVGEGDNVLVFRRHAKVIRAEVHPRTNGDFSSSVGPPHPQPIRRAAARFTVVPTAGATAQDAPRFRLEYKG